MKIREQLEAAMKLQIDGDLAEAKKTCGKVLDTHPINADAMHMLGLILSEENDTERAIDLIKKAIQQNPVASAFHHNIAGIYRRLGRLKEAESEFR